MDETPDVTRALPWRAVVGEDAVAPAAAASCEDPLIEGDCARVKVPSAPEERDTREFWSE